MSKTSDNFMKHTLKRIKQLETLQKKQMDNNNRALVIQQLKYLIQTFEESK